MFFAKRGLVCAQSEVFLTFLKINAWILSDFFYMVAWFFYMVSQ